VFEYLAHRSKISLIYEAFMPPMCPPVGIWQIYMDDDLPASQLQVRAPRSELLDSYKGSAVIDIEELNDLDALAARAAGCAFYAWDCPSNLREILAELIIRRIHAVEETNGQVYW
jgi:hypothetical protein